MRVDTFNAEIKVRYTKQHSIYPDIKFGENMRFDIPTTEGKVIANISDLEKVKFGIGEESTGRLTARWIGGIDEEYKHKLEIPVIVMNEELGVCEIIRSSITSTNE